MAEAARATRPPLWRDVRVLRVAGQVVFVLAVVILLRELYLNADFQLDRRGDDLSFDFLDQRAGFEIKEGISYSPNQSVRRAYTVGVVNALTVALVGIVLATILGLAVGVARLSTNWLVRKISQVYVEIIRNTPLLVQVVFWWAVVFLSIRTIDNSFSFGSLAFLSNRGMAIPALRHGSDFGTWMLFLLVGVVAAILVWRWRTRRHEATGQPHYRVLFGLGVFVLIATVGYLLLGDAFYVEEPELQRFNYAGGLQMSPEFGGLLFALVIYTATFIGEIVRGSILAVSKGQKEAAEALGLRPRQQLRFVVIPQALRIAVPPINSQYLNLWKNTSLGFAIGYPEIINISGTIINQTGNELQVFTLFALTYLAVSLAISAVMNVVNRAVALKGERR
ncbi:MAG: amino acid ABC transporter permease [Actinomycetota bacterium]